MRSFAWSLFVLVWTVFAFGQQAEKLTLEQCIQIAVENNAALQQTRLNNEAADYDVTGSYSDIMPSLDLSFRKGESNIGRSERIITDAVIGVDPATGQPIYGTVTATTPKQYSKDHSFTVTVNQLIYDGGRWWNSIRKANVDKESSDLELQGEESTTVLAVQEAYFDLVKQIKIYDVNKVAVQRSQDQLQRTEKMYELGSRARLDVFQAKVNLGNDRINLLTQENVVEDARRNLNITMGREPDKPLDVIVDPVVQAEINDMGSLVDMAMETNPYLEKSEVDIKSSELGISLAQASYYPRLSTYFQYNRRNSDFEKIYDDLNREYVWSVGLQLSWNLFNGLEDHVFVQKSKLSKRSAEIAYNDIQRRLKSRIHALHANYVSYLEIIEINRENLAAAREELRLAQERYQVGAGTSLEVREAQVKLTQAEQTLIAAQYNALITKAQLDNETGVTVQKLNEL